MRDLKGMLGRLRGQTIGPKVVRAAVGLVEHFAIGDLTDTPLEGR